MVEHKEKRQVVSFIDDDDDDDDEDKDVNGHRTDADGGQTAAGEAENQKKKLAPHEEWKRTLWRKRTGVKNTEGIAALQAEKQKRLSKISRSLWEKAREVMSGRC